MQKILKKVASRLGFIMNGNVAYYDRVPGGDSKYEETLSYLKRVKLSEVIGVEYAAENTTIRLYVKKEREEAAERVKQANEFFLERRRLLERGDYCEAR